MTRCFVPCLSLSLGQSSYSNLRNFSDLCSRPNTAFCTNHSFPPSIALVPADCNLRMDLNYNFPYAECCTRTCAIHIEETRSNISLHWHSVRTSQLFWEPVTSVVSSSLVINKLALSLESALIDAAGWFCICISL